MMYLEITSVPVTRDDNPVYFPGAAMAARLGSTEETVELRLHREAGKTRCYLGVSAKLQLEQAAIGLKGAGYGVKMNQNPLPVTTTLLLGRRMVVRYAKTAAGNQQVFVPEWIRSNPRHAGELFTALDALEDGNGIACFFRLSPPLLPAVSNQLSAMNPEAGSIPHEILRRTRFYEFAGAVYGPQSQLLASELCGIYPGIEAQPCTPAGVNPELLNQLRSGAMPPGVRAMGRIILEEEIEAISDITASAGIYGLPVNPDTLCGVRKLPAQKEEPSVIIGSSAANTRISLPLSAFRKGIAIDGPIGSGKSNLIMSTAIQLADADVNILLIEPTKDEYKALHSAIPELQYWEPKGGKFVCNPFALPDGVTLGEYRSSLNQILRESFHHEGALYALFKDSLNACFAMHGYTDESTSEDPDVRPFGMAEMIGVYAQMLEEAGYSGRTTADMKTAGLTRLEDLFLEDRAMFDSIRTVPVSQLLSGVNVLNLNCITSVAAKQFFASLMILQIGALLKLRWKHTSKLKLVIILDEAQFLLDPEENTQGNVFSFAKSLELLMLTLRSYGVGFICGSQRFSKIPNGIFEACQTKIFLGASHRDGLYQIREEARADDATMRNLHRLKPGDGLLYSADMQSAVFFRSTLILDLLHPEQEHPKANRFLKNNPRFCIETYQECANCPVRGKCTSASKNRARQQATALLPRYSAKIEAAYHSEEPSRRLHPLLCQIVEELPDDETVRNCAFIQFMRDMKRKRRVLLNMQRVLELAAKRKE